MVDGTCPIPKFAGSVKLFGVTPGAHTIGLATSPRGKTLLSCAGHVPVDTISENVAAGQRHVVLMYGTPKDGMKIMAAPIAMP